MNGTVRSIHVRPAPGAPVKKLSQVMATPGRGLSGDHAHDAAQHGDPLEGGKEVTLIESEAIEAIRRESGIDVDPGDARRNIVTQGVALNHLVHRDIQIGEVILRGVRLCEPCAHLESLTRNGICAALVHRGGLRAAVIRGGTIRKGDPISVAAPAAATH